MDDEAFFQQTDYKFIRNPANFIGFTSREPFLLNLAYFVRHHILKTCQKSDMMSDKVSHVKPAHTERVQFYMSDMSRMAHIFVEHCRDDSKR